MRRPLLLGLCLLFTAACSGDGDSTGSSQVLVGTYRGTASFVVTVGPASQGASGPIVIVVSPGNQVTVGQFPPVQLSGTQFATSLPASFFNQPGSGLNCTQGSFDVQGTFAGTTVSGPISSTGLQCNGFAVTIAGSYTATLTTQVPRGYQDREFLETVRDALHRALPAR